MGLSVLFSAGNTLWEAYRAVLPQAFETAGLEVDLARDHPAEMVDYIIYAPNDHLSDFTPYTRCKGVLSLWAGVERIVTNTTLTQPLAKMVNPDLTQSMVEWVTGHVLRHHLGIDRQILDQSGDWTPVFPPLAKQRPVTVLGLGTLGAACAQALVGLGFPVSGWSRSPKDVAGVVCHAGADGLQAALSGAEIVVLLLPDTPGTTQIIDADSLALMAPGSYLINPGRGPLIDDAALLAALDRGHLAHATLDVFRVEPLPRDHAFWAHPRVTVTPHIAAETRPPTAAINIAQNIARCEAGEPLHNLVDRTLGY